MKHAYSDGVVRWGSEWYPESVGIGNRWAWFRVIVGVAHLVACFSITLEYMVNNLPAFNKSVKEYMKEISGCMGSLLYYLALSVTSILGLTGQYGVAFYGIHVLHLAQGNDKLVRALQAVTNNGSELLAVMMLIISFVYV